MCSVEKTFTSTYTNDSTGKDEDVVYLF